MGSHHVGHCHILFCIVSVQGSITYIALVKTVNEHYNVPQYQNSTMHQRLVDYVSVHVILQNILAAGTDIDMDYF